MIKNVKLSFELDGKQVSLPINVSEDDIRAMLVEEHKPLNPTGYERVKPGEFYWTYDENFSPYQFKEEKSPANGSHWRCGKYFYAEEVAHGVAFYTELWSRIRAYAARNRYTVTASDWEDDEKEKFVITYHMIIGEFEVCAADSTQLKEFGTVYFNSRAAAQETLDLFIDELTELYENTMSEALNVFE